MDNLRSITFDNQYFLRLNSGKALRRGVTGSSEACLACPQTPMMDPTSGPWKSGRTASQSQTLPCVECRLASFFVSSSSQMRTELSVGNYLGARRSLTVLRLLLLLPGFAVAVVRAHRWSGRDHPPTAKSARRSCCQSCGVAVCDASPPLWPAEALLPTLQNEQSNPTAAQVMKLNSSTSLGKFYLLICDFVY